MLLESKHKMKKRLKSSCFEVHVHLCMDVYGEMKHVLIVIGKIPKSNSQGKLLRILRANLVAKTKIFRTCEESGMYNCIAHHKTSSPFIIDNYWLTISFVEYPSSISNV